MRLSPGTRVGPYVVDALLGVGGMGEVYRARDERLHRSVALKFPPAATEASDAASRRLLREARAAAALDHPYICKIFEVGEADGLAYIAMECVTGTTLRDTLRQGRLPLKTAVRLALEMAEALDTAHKAGLVHRDFKPSNVIVGADGHAKVLDFGLATRVDGPLRPEVATQTLSHPGEGKLTGTPSYMAPEQLRGEAADARADIFAFGIVLYELLTGQHPFRGATVFDLSHAILADDPVTWPAEAAAPGLLQHIALKALAKDREARYQSMREVVTDLAAAAGSSESASVPLAPQRVTPARSVWPRWAVATVGVAAAVAGAVYWQRQYAAPASAPPMQRTQVTSLGNVMDAVISPDGSQVAYLTVQGRDHVVSVQDLRGGTALEIIRSELQTMLQAWSPDGGHVVVRQFDDVSVPAVLIPRLGGTPRPIAGAEQLVAWSPDGTKLATTRLAARRIVVRSRVGDTNERLLEVPDASTIRYLGWSTVDDVIVAFGRDQQSARGLWIASATRGTVARVPLGPRVSECVAAPATAEVYCGVLGNDALELRALDLTDVTYATWRIVQPNLPPCRSLTVSADGEQLMCIRRSPRFTVQRVDLSQPSATAVVLAERTTHVGEPSVSPDSRTVAIPMAIGDRVRLMTMSIDGGEAVPRETSGGSVVAAQWSPDGRKMFYLARGDGQTAGWLLDLQQQQSEPVSLPGLSTRPFVTWTPAGELAWPQVTAASFHNYRIRNLATNEESMVGRDAEGGWLFEPRFSPKGDRVAVFWNRTPGRGLWLLGWPDRHARLLAPELLPLGWAADGESVYALPPNAGEIRIVSTVSGEVQPLLRLRKGTIIGASPTPDGKYFVMTVDDGQEDAWLISGFDPLVRRRTPRR